MKTSILRVTGSIASVASCLVLFGGVASATTETIEITNTGDYSDNRVSVEEKCEVTIHNNNTVNVENNNNQNANSGNASAGGTGGTSGTDLASTTTNPGGGGSGEVGDVSTGDATNTNTTTVNVSINNNPNISCFLTQIQAPAAPVGGSGAGGPVVVPAATHTLAPTGGMGAGEEEFVVQQVATRPVGGVGAGSGGQEYLGGLAAVTLLSGAFAARRLQRSFKTQL